MYGCLRKPATLPNRLLALSTAIALIVVQLAIPPRAEASHLGSSTASAGSAPPPAITAIESFQPDLFTGRATTSIPIAVPPGRKGMQPDLALTYSSSGRNGLLGVGWNLDLGSIERSTKNGVPKYDTSDTYTFMFQGVTSDLVKIPDGTYRAKHEGAFLRVESKGFDGWEVKDKSGTRYLFGGTPDSEIRNASAQVFRWGLRKAIDTSGNYLEVTYTVDQGQMYPAEIRYTGHEPTALLPPHRVVLTYESRPDVDRSLRAGMLITTAKRLKEIAAYAADQLARKVVLTYTTSARTGRSLLASVTQIGSDGITTLPQQTFTYQADAPSYVWQSNTSASGRPNWNLRTRAFDVGPNNFGCLHPYAVLFNQPKLLNQSGSGSQGSVSWTIASQGELSLRGSKDDHVHAWTYLYTAQAKTLSLSLGAIDAPTNACTWVEDSTGLRQVTASSLSLNAGWSILHVTDYHEQGSFSSQLSSPLRTLVDTMNPTLFSLPQLAGDVNRDGIADLVTFDVTKSPTEWRVALGTGIGFRPESVWLVSPAGFASSSRTPVLGDFNGGGKTDIAVVNTTSTPGRWHFGESTGTSFDAWGFPSVTFAPGSVPFLGDFDGDGKTDLGGFMKDTGGWHVLLNPETAQLQQQWLSGFGAGQEPLSGDFNGDGLTDVAYVDASNGVYVALSTGTAFRPEAAAWHTSFPGRSTMTSADFNGDGLTDIAYFDAPSGQVLWAASDGSRFGPLQLLYSAFTIRASDAILQVADANGDGLADPSVFHSATASSELAFSNGSTPDLLATINNGLGGTTAITYKSSSQLDNTGDDNLPDLPFVVPVVSQVSASDGLGNTYTTRYTYEGGKYEKDTKEFRGFRKVQVLDAEANVTETLFWQTEFKQGLAQSVEVRDALGNIMSRQENSWSSVEVVPGSRFARLTQTDTFTYDGDATFRQTRTRFTMYDAFGNLAKVIEEGEVAVLGDERVTRTYFVYNESAWILDTPAQVKVSSLDGLTVFSQRTFFYDGNPSYTWDPIVGQLIPQAPPTIGNLTKESERLADAADPTTTLTYDAFGNVKTVTDALGRVTTNTYEATGTYLTQITNALGHTRQLAYDARFGAVTSSIDPNGLKTQTAYDALGRVTQTSFIDPATLAEVITGKIEYDLVSRPLRTTTTVYAKAGLQSPVTTYQFADGLGRVIQARAPAEDPTKQVVTGAVEFNARGLVVKQWVSYLSNMSSSYVPMSLVSGLASPVSYAYDAAGRLIRVTDPDGSATTTSYSDWSTTVTDANGHRTTRMSDAYGRLIKVEELNGFDVYVTTYEYHPLNNLTKLTDAKGNVTTIAYDQLSRKLSMIDPDMGTWTYTYDAVDNLKTQTDARGVKTTFTYDTLNRLTKKSYTIPLGSVIPSPGTVTYSYDNTGKPFTKGRLTAITDGSGQSAFEYDALGRLIKETKKLDGSSYTIQRAYDLLGRLTSLKYPDGETVTYTYNAQGGIERVASSKQIYVSNVDYNAAGQLTKIAYGNGVATDYSYNPQTLRLSSLLTRNSSLATLQDFSYTLDAVGNVTQILDRVRTASQSFAYDDLNRLTYASGSYGTLTYAYDPIGNMTTKEGISQFYGLPGGTKPHAISSTSDGKTFAYDANGNRLSQTAPAGTTTSTYDAEGRLKQVAAPSGTTSFVYDGDGGRVKQTTLAGSTRYVGEVYEIAPNGTKTKYVFAGSLRLAAKDSTGATRFYHTDHLGSSNVVTDKTGVIVEVAEYTPYGSLSRREGSANVPQKFTGQRLDASTGLYFYQARYYDPAVGRFLSPDPFVQAPDDPQTLNRYAYVRNNPVNLVDPSGHFWFIPFIIAVVKAAAIGAAVGAAVNATVAAIRGENVGRAALRGAVAGAASGALLGGGGFLIGAQGLALAGTAKTLAEVGIAATSGAVGGGIDSRFQGGTFAAGLGPGAIGGVLGYGVGRVVGAERWGLPTPEPGAVGQQVGLAQSFRQWLKNDPVEVFRVEGAANTRISIGPGGQVGIPDTSRTLFLNFGQQNRANAFFQQRLRQGLPGTTIKSFKVNRSFLDQLRQSAVKEAEAKSFPNNPFLVDVTKAPDQFGLRTPQIYGLLKNIRRGSGEVLE